MTTVINELGKSIPCAGSEGSPLWIKLKYSRQLHSQIESYLKQVMEGVKNPVIQFDGETKYNLDFVRAVRLYAEFPDFL